MSVLGARAHAQGLDTLRLALLLVCGCGLVISGVEATRVALYMKESKGVLDLFWDDGPRNLELQLQQLGFNVQSFFDAEPVLIGENTPAAYIIPSGNGANSYSSVEDMSVVAAYLAAGGLVIITKAVHDQGEALRSFVSNALGYQGM